MRVKNKNNKNNSLIKKLAHFFYNKKEKLAINNNKKYMKEDSDLNINDYRNSTDINLIKIVDK